MTKILYITTGQFLYFYTKTGNYSAAFEDAYIHKEVSLRELMEMLLTPYDYLSVHFIDLNKLPKQCLSEEFEIVYD